MKMAQLLQSILRRFGFQLVRNTQPQALVGYSNGNFYTLPPKELEQLRNDNPRLIELRERYDSCDLPMAAHTWWTEDYVNASLDLKNFRGDNAYVWQTKHMGESALQRYYLYLRDVESRDELNLLSQLTEDGAFGAWVYRYHRHSAVSRDLLDSVNEINFLARHVDIVGKNTRKINILDIGAGYGRLAYRCNQALPHLDRYFCVDAVAESTFIAERYIDYRGSRNKVTVLPLDELDTLHGNRIDIAINIHSFSEMSADAVDAWIEIVSELGVRYFFVIPNDAEAFLTMESDGTRRDFLPIVERYGFKSLAKEPVIRDPDVRELVGVNDYMFLFERKGK